MSYYFPFGIGESKSDISFALTAISASVPTSKSVLMPTAITASNVVTAGVSGTSGISRTLANCSGTQGTTGAQGATGAQGDKGTDRGTGDCPPGTKECTSLNASLAALNATLGPNDQFGVVCIDLNGEAASAVNCPDTLPSGVPTLPAYT